MSDLLSARKLYVDSRFLKSGTPSNFNFELPEVLDMPRDTVAYITEFTGVCAWDTVNQSNYRFYIVEQAGGVNKGRIVDVAQQPHDSESLRADLETKLNGAGKLAGMGTYTVTSDEDDERRSYRQRLAWSRVPLLQDRVFSG